MEEETESLQAQYLRCGGAGDVGNVWWWPAQKGWSLSCHVFMLLMRCLHVCATLCPPPCTAPPPTRRAQLCSRCLLEVARAADGFSGRTLRKLPFLAHASHDFPGGRCSCLQYVNALLAAVQAERADRATLSSGGHT